MIAFEKFGVGEPLVLLHGMGHRRQGWMPVVNQLSNSHEVFILDLPGHGESSELLLDKNNFFDEVCDQLSVFFITHKIERPHLVGNSLGARIALELAVRGNARSVTALAPSAFWGSNLEIAYAIAVFSTIMIGSQIPERIINRLLESSRIRQIAMKALMANPSKLPATDAQADLSAFRSAVPTIFKLSDCLKPFKSEISSDIPISIVWAEKDMILLNQAQHAERAKKLFPHARHLVLKGCGHIPIYDDPNLVAETIINSVLFGE